MSCLAARVSSQSATTRSAASRSQIPGLDPHAPAAPRSAGAGHELLNVALSGETDLNMLDSCVGEEIILLISGINMQGVGGLDLLAIVKDRRPALPVA
jgi:hypothetical protein